MASYTYIQLSGTGSIGENLSGLKTFTFINPRGSSYLVLETITTSSFYSNASPTNFRGTYSASIPMGLVTSSYVASVVVPPGSSVFIFTPTSAVTGTTYYLKGTGMYSLVIS
jgi:hypothetical protein